MIESSIGEQDIVESIACSSRRISSQFATQACSIAHSPTMTAAVAISPTTAAM